MNVSTKILNKLLERGDTLERFTDSQINDVLIILEQANSEIIGKIAATKGQMTREWLVALKEDIDQIYSSAMTRAKTKVFGQLKELAGYETEYTADILKQNTIGVSINTPGVTSIWASIVALPASDGLTLSELFDAMHIGSAKEVIKAIQVGMVEGETTEQLVRRIRGRAVKASYWTKDENGKRVRVPGVYEGGVMDTTTHGARTLVTTATAHVSNVARETLYQENDDLIKGYQYCATLDADTCLICGAYDVTTYDKDEPKPELPLHPNCRCFYAPVIKSWRELGIDKDEAPPGMRASMDGHVPETETYKDRLEKASPARRLAMLGPSRAKLYEQGVSLDKMVEGGQVLTLKEISDRMSKK